MHAAEHVSCSPYGSVSRTLTLSLNKKGVSATRRHRAPTWHQHGVWGGSLSSLRFAPPPAYEPNGDIAPSHRQHSTHHEGRRLRLTAQNGPSQTHQ